MEKSEKLSYKIYSLDTFTCTCTCVTVVFLIKISNEINVENI